MKKLLIAIASILAVQTVVDAQSKVLTPEMLAMSREKMVSKDDQVLLFNGRGMASPRQYSATGITAPKFYPIDLPDYDFYINFREVQTGTEIRDDVPIFWEEWTTHKRGMDPLGCNFRPYAPMVMVTQDEVWQPNMYTRTGTFHKEIDGQWISFSTKTWTSVSGDKDEIFLRLQIHNRDKQTLSMILEPHQIAGNMGVFDPRYAADTSSVASVATNFYTLASEQLRVSVSSSVVDTVGRGFRVSIGAGQTADYYFAIQMDSPKNAAPALYQSDIADRMQRADRQTRDNLQWAAEQLPAFESDDKQLTEFYIRSIYTVLTCRWNRENFIAQPFWSVGYWPFTISWDTSYASDLLGLLEPESLKEAILVDFREGRLQKTYISWAGAFWDILYIQEPFAVQTMIEAYVRQTGDVEIFEAMAGDASVYEWLTRWAAELHDNYGRPDGLIDIGYNTEKIIEIRTDGYNHVVPIVNCLTLKLYKKMVEWATLNNKPKDSKKFGEWAAQLENSINTQLWNEELGWYDNLYPDGQRGSVWTFHLFDVLNSTAASAAQQQRLISHLREGEFLGKFGVYSIAKKDTLHWDRIDADWGGGGQYIGMPGRISRNLFEMGFATMGLDVLKRYAGYIDYFPYLSQNPAIDSPSQDQSSMPNEISGGAGFEAIVFGLMGVKPHDDGTIEFNPNYFAEVGNCRLTDYNFRGNKYSIIVTPTQYTVLKNGEVAAVKKYGEKTIL